MEIRRLTAADAPAFRAIRLEALAAHPADFGSDHADEAARPLAHFVAQLLDNHVLGLFRDGALAGIAAIEFHAKAKERHRAFLWGVYVRPAARGTGAAEALLRAAMEAAFARAVQIELGVRAGNAAAEGLYRRLGFTRYGVQPRINCVDGVFHDEALMVAAKLEGKETPACESRREATYRAQTSQNSRSSCAARTRSSHGATSYKSNFSASRFHS